MYCSSKYQVENITTRSGFYFSSLYCILTILVQFYEQQVISRYLFLMFHNSVQWVSGNKAFEMKYQTIQSESNLCCSSSPRTDAIFEISVNLKCKLHLIQFVIEIFRQIGFSFLFIQRNSATVYEVIIIRSIIELNIRQFIFNRPISIYICFYSSIFLLFGF